MPLLCAGHLKLSPSLRCSCTTYTQPPPEKTPPVDGTIVHELPREDVASAYRAGLLVPVQRIFGDGP